VDELEAHKFQAASPVSAHIWAILEFYSSMEKRNVHPEKGEGAWPGDTFFNGPSSFRPAFVAIPQLVLIDMIRTWLAAQARIKWAKAESREKAEQKQRQKQKQKQEASSGVKERPESELESRNRVLPTGSSFLRVALIA